MQTYRESSEPILMTCPGVMLRRSVACHNQKRMQGESVMTKKAETEMKGKQPGGEGGHLAVAVGRDEHVVHDPVQQVFVVWFFHGRVR